MNPNAKHPLTPSEISIWANAIVSPILILPGIMLILDTFQFRSTPDVSVHRPPIHFKFFMEPGHRECDFHSGFSRGASIPQPPSYPAPQSASAASSFTTPTRNTTPYQPSATPPRRPILSPWPAQSEYTWSEFFEHCDLSEEEGTEAVECLRKIRMDSVKALTLVDTAALLSAGIPLGYAVRLINGASTWKQVVKSRRGGGGVSS